MGMQIDLCVVCSATTSTHFHLVRGRIHMYPVDKGLVWLAL